MRRKSTFKLLGWVLLLLSSVNVMADAEVAVIANKSLAVDTVPVSLARKLWLGKSHTIPGVGKVTVVDQQPGNGVTKIFYKKVVKKTPNQLKAYWAKVVFTGKGYPPRAFDSNEEVLSWVAATPNGLGYVDSSAVGDSVKVLFTIKQ